MNIKIRDKRETTGEGRYPVWEFFDALVNVLGPKHSTEPPTVVESFPQIGPDHETQDMSGEPAVCIVLYCIMFYSTYNNTVDYTITKNENCDNCTKGLLVTGASSQSCTKPCFKQQHTNEQGE